MPTYTFQCNNCESVEEHMLTISKRDTTKLKCKNCGNRLVRSTDVPQTAIMVGGGWYKDGYSSFKPQAEKQV